MTTRQRWDFTFNWLVSQGGDAYQRELLRKWVHTGEMPKADEEEEPTADLSQMPAATTRPAKPVSMTMNKMGGGRETIQTTQDDIDMVSQLRQGAIAQRAAGES